MWRTGLANFAGWAAVVLPATYFLNAGRAGTALIVVGALVVAWRTPYWPEALGVVAGYALLSLLAGVWKMAYAEMDGGFDFVVAAAVSGAAFFTWTHALSRYDPDDKPVETRPRLITASVLAALSLLLVNFFLWIGFGFAHCAGDTTPTPPPGSDLASYCDQIGGQVGMLVLFGPSVLALTVGLSGALMRRGGLAALALIAAIVLTVAAHVPDFVITS